jgi:predicted AAA+ superfamily ATPase
LNDLIRGDVLEFSRSHEINTMRLFVELLRERVESPLTLALIAGDLAVSPATLKRYLEILQALFSVFTIQPSIVILPVRFYKVRKSIFSIRA